MRTPPLAQFKALNKHILAQMLMSKVMVNEETLPLILLKAEVPQNSNFLCLQLRMALVHVVHLSIQQLAACISSLLNNKNKKKKRQSTMHLIQDTMEGSTEIFKCLVLQWHSFGEPTCI